MYMPCQRRKLDGKRYENDTEKPAPSAILQVIFLPVDRNSMFWIADLILRLFDAHVAGKKKLPKRGSNLP